MGLGLDGHSQGARSTPGERGEESPLDPRGTVAVGILQPGDLEEGLNAASAIGDDAIREATEGRVNPESFTHGTSEQR